MKTVFSLSVIVCLLSWNPAPAKCADEFERAPIEYSRGIPDNRVSDLQKRIDRGEMELRHDENFGYLPALLESLQINRESQMLVFSKTSKQRDRITPRAPRALYFNDDTYLGFCHHGDFLELSVADPQLGAVFYSLDQKQAAHPRLVRQTDNCLQCHGTSLTDGVPGHIVRSVFVDAGGLPLLAEGSHLVNHTTPLGDRWGGWYVTGKHGQQPHLGNLVIRNSPVKRPLNNEQGQNVIDISNHISVSNYLTSHSDIVALMVLEHQVLIHNLITQANFTCKQALHYESVFNRALGVPEDQRLESTTSRIQNVGDKLVEGLLFVGEAPLTSSITGTTKYAELFSKTGSRDSQGRSLREFDLTTRMFKYPCSYLVYTSAFDNLPPLVKAYVAMRLHRVLTGDDPDPSFSHLSADDRRAILEILTETKPDLWKQRMAAPTRE